MSAFIVSKAHIDALLTASVKRSGLYGPMRYHHDGETHEARPDSLDAIGQMLWDENRRSVEFRYPDSDDLPGSLVSVQLAEGVEPLLMAEILAPYRYAPLEHITPSSDPRLPSHRRPFSPIEVLKLVQCFEYQSCETADWEESEAYAFCDALRGQMIHQLPGYEDARWAL